MEGDAPQMHQCDPIDEGDFAVGKELKVNSDLWVCCEKNCDEANLMHHQRKCVLSMKGFYP